MRSPHIGIIGAGTVGSSIAFALMIKNIGSVITIVDINEQKVEGEVMDLCHGLFFVETAHIKQGTYQDMKKVDIIIVTAGIAQRPGETRLDLVKKNTQITQDIFKQIGQLSPQTIILMVSNPVDILTYIVQEITDLPQNQIMGSGTVLDTSRLRYYLGNYFTVNPDSVHAYIIGEHGDSELAVYSLANIANLSLENFKQYNVHKLQKILQKTKQAAYEIIKRKGATNYAIALVVADILEAIIYDQNKVLPLSVRLDSYYQNTFQVPAICLGVPAIVGRSGIKSLIDIKLDQSEALLFQKSALSLGDNLHKLGFKILPNKK